MKVLVKPEHFDSAKAKLGDYSICHTRKCLIAEALKDVIDEDFVVGHSAVYNNASVKLYTLNKVACNLIKAFDRALFHNYETNKTDVSLKKFNEDFVLPVEIVIWGEPNE